ncbi:MAG: ABC transporter ATP-binding protein [Bifidobacteriaceae bacterium]|jgi:thiamine transport system ATP-binding protein|nr:ABC transporter ATP-binding protein [Bifidobacteriaceae bacterium]
MSEPSPANPAPTGRGLDVRGVTVRFGQALAVDGASLQMDPGQVLAVLGPSGSGKSTLLRVIVGLESGEGGQVRWDGQDMVGVPVHKRGFGLLFQDAQLFAHLNVAANVAYGLPRGPDRRERTAAMLRLVDLPGFDRRDVRTLSGGEQQRVALARALAPRPRLLLLDEPLSGLDASLRRHLASQIRQILAAEHVTAIFVTHDQDEAFAIADHVAVMLDGRIAQLDQATTLWHYPASEQVARFLGCRWFTKGRLSHTDGVARPLVHTEFGSVLLPGWPAGPPPGTQVQVGLRPGTLTVAESNPSLANAQVKATTSGAMACIPIGKLGPIEVRVRPKSGGDEADFTLDPATVAVIAGRVEGSGGQTATGT